MRNVRKEIKLRRALILGNFYDQKVQIVQLINGAHEALHDTIVGIQPEYILTKKAGSIPKKSIKTIYQL